MLAVLARTSTAFADGSTHCDGTAQPRFVDGFADLRNRVGTPVGVALSCEFPDPNATGDVQQVTSTGLAFWRKSTNTPTFTNGFDHWALTSAGLVVWTGAGLQPPNTPADQSACVTGVAAVPQRSAAIALAIQSTPPANLVTWTNSSPGNWNVGTNWSGGVVPGATDDGVISMSTTTVTVSSSIGAIHSLELDAGSLSLLVDTTVPVTTTLVGGTLTGSGTLIVPNGATFTWTGGTRSGSGTTQIASGGTPLITYACCTPLTLDQRGLTNAGLVTWMTNYSSLTVQNGVPILNQAAACSTFSPIKPSPLQALRQHSAMRVPCKSPRALAQAPLL